MRRRLAKLGARDVDLEQHCPDLTTASASPTIPRTMVQPAEPTISDLAARARRVIPGGVNSAQRQVPGLEDLVITSTHGSTFTDDRGRTFTDYHAAFGPPLLGHNDPDVDRAVAQAGARLDNVGVGVSPLEIELAEKLVQHVPS